MFPGGERRQMNMGLKKGDRVFVKAIAAEDEADDFTCRLTVDNTEFRADAKEVHPLGEKDRYAEMYELGMNDAWGLMRRIERPESAGGIAGKDLRGIFCTEDFHEILDRFTAAEAKKKIDTWERERAIRAGDIVVIEESDEEAIVTHSGDDICNLLWSDGISGVCQKYRLNKTGRHISIEALLAQIGGAEDGIQEGR